MKLVFLDAATLHNGDIDFSPFEQFGELVFHELTSPDQTAERLAEADIVITNKVVIREEHIAQAPNLKLIAAAATGVNHLDLEGAKRHGVPACNVSGYSTKAVAQHAFSFILSFATSLHLYAPAAQQWPEFKIFTSLAHPVFELDGKTLGIAGYGSIGQEVAKLARAFGMKVVALSRTGTGSADDEVIRLPREEFFAQSDVISLHSPLTAETEKMINAETLSLMKRGALLINTGRGPLIDEAALAEALRSGHLGGAGLDVLSVEPPSADNPLLADGVPNLLITPHTAWAALESRSRLIDGLINNIKGFVAGDLPNRVA